MSITKICSCGYVGYAALHDKKGTDVVCEHFAKDIEAEATKPQEHKPLGPATAEDQAIYNSIVSNYFESGALDWMQNIDAAMKEPSFQEARALMGTENYGQDVALLQALRCLISRMSNVTKPQEPVAIYHGVMDCGEFGAFNLEILKMIPRGANLYTTPQPCPNCAEGMALVTKEDAENYCQILTLLGMEEEGSPVEEVKRLISLHEGMTCGDCNDTGWLENREEGRYPCTCMTEAEPYQILEAKCAELEAKVEQLKMVPMKYRRMEFNAQLQRENMELRVERDALAAQLNRVRRALDAEP